MDPRHLAHADADPDFYDDVWQVSPDAADVLGPAVVPERVEVSDQGPWRVYRTPCLLPDSGWKVHVSCVPSRAEHVVPLVVAEALAEDLTCKHLRTRRLVAATQAKYAEPAGAGKVVTVYPVDETSLARIVARLTVLLAGEPGARVLSDVPVDGAPVSVRFGAFRGVRHLDAQGRWGIGRVGDTGTGSAADDRSPHSGCRGAAVVPALVAALRDAASARDRGALLPVTDVRVVHRSNAGGVYSATWEDGRRVVLKEARRHTGFDLAGSDAVTRLRHERRALERLAGTGVVPEVVAHHVAGDSEFLVMEHVAGPTVTSGMATGHPAAVPGADAATYRTWVDAVVTRTGEALAVLHAHGVTHRDVHPGNVIERDGRVVLVDLESSAVDGVAVAKGVATALSSTGDDVTPAADLAALARMGALLVNPQYALTARRPELAAELSGVGEADLAGPDGVGHGGGAVADPGVPPVPVAPCRPTPPCPERLVAGLHVAADPARPDRLLPSDVAGFSVPGGGLGLLHGAGGVLATLAATGRPVPDAWRGWLVQRSLDAPWLAPGLADGAEGIALCLARIGERDAARTLVDRWADRESASPWWSRGSAGRALAHAELAGLLDEPALVASALGLVADTLERVEADVPPPGVRAGLLDGWAGVGLALLRVAELVDGHAGGGVTTRLRAAAHRAMRRECAAVHVRAGAWLASDGTRVMPYLGTGSAALGLLAAALGGRPDAGLPVSDTAPDPAAVTPDEAVTGVVRALELRSVAGAGLLHGRAGLLATLAVVAPAHPAVTLHRERLGWYTVPVAGTSRREHPLAGDADLLLGDQNIRCSADLGSGSAGAILVGDEHVDRTARAVTHVLGLPEVHRSVTRVTPGMTPVTTSH
ncbi:hypothetical protein [Arthrobacter sp. NEB 688]|uniref:class III lanthionine synthetase LanKC N-terminal domain-containing protein n=1 Tax=Arthrobacter sp. NEB 688 TaxID=904039 RepID=UPI00156515E9|nr:hypothetical protein [Arthrobacter sp. NEB 688]QKE83121.1 hypothetical protein HL663_03555 [Arthrobacter sp. NEB 688]